MKLWIVLHWMMDAGSSILGVYDNEPQAIERRKNYIGTQKMSTFEGTRIEKYELNQDYKGDWEIADGQHWIDLEQLLPPHELGEKPE